MSGARRTRLAIEASRRSREQRAQLGGEVRRSRERRDWTQVELADRAGLSRHIVGRIERADADRCRRAAADRHCLQPAPRDPLRARRWSIQRTLAISQCRRLILRLGRDIGYVGDFELPTRPAEPWRSIDVVLASPTRRIMILVECWNTFGDIGSAARASMRKAAELEELAAGRWGPDVIVRVLWVVRATARNRALLARYPEVFAARFPGSSRVVG